MPGVGRAGPGDSSVTNPGDVGKLVNLWIPFLYLQEESTHQGFFRIESKDLNSDSGRRELSLVHSYLIES